MPFPAKKKVFDAALTAAILYSSETWLSPAACKAAAPLYADCVRTLLGVRKTTATELCMVEIGVPTLSQRVGTLHKSAIEKLTTQRANLLDDPFTFALSVARETRCPAAHYIDVLHEYNPEAETALLHERIQQSDRSKYMTYVQKMNPSLSVHDMYALNDADETRRLTTIRIRLSSHNRAIERGRWSRIPREERLCSCGAIQDEEHISARCPTTNGIRDSHPDIDFSFPAIMQSPPPRIMLSLFHELYYNFV